MTGKWPNKVCDRWERSTRGGYDKYTQHFSRKPAGKNTSLGELDVVVRITLTWILKTEVGNVDLIHAAQARDLWQATVGAVTLVFHKTRGFCWLAEQLIALEERFCSMEVWRCILEDWEHGRGQLNKNTVFVWRTGMRSSILCSLASMGTVWLHRNYTFLW